MEVLQKSQAFLPKTQQGNFLVYHTVIAFLLISNPNPVNIISSIVPESFLVSSVSQLCCNHVTVVLHFQGYSACLIKLSARLDSEIHGAQSASPHSTPELERKNKTLQNTDVALPLETGNSQ